MPVEGDQRALAAAVGAQVACRLRRRHRCAVLASCLAPLPWVGAAPTLHAAPTPCPLPSPQFVNFAFVPRHLRIPYVAAVSFGWTVILSVMQGKFDAAIAQRKAVVGVAGAGGGSAGAVAVAQAAAEAAAGGAAKAPAAPSLLPAAAAAVVQQQAATPAAAAAGSGSATSTHLVRGLPTSPLVAAAVAEAPRQQAAAVKDA